MGTVGPGSIHLLNGLYDAKKSHAPVLAICGQVPLAELGSDFFQEVDNDVLFADVAGVPPDGHRRPRRCRGCSSRRSRRRYAERGRRGADAARRRRRARRCPKGARAALHRRAGAAGRARRGRAGARPPTLIDAAATVTMLVGMRRPRGPRRGAGAGRARSRAPMVLTLKAKEGLERDNPFQVGQTGLIGNPAARAARSTTCDLLLMVGTDFPYRDWYPTGKTVVQIDAARRAHRPADPGRRRRSSATPAPTLAALLAAARPRKPTAAHLDRPATALRSRWRERAAAAGRPRPRRAACVGKVRVAVRQPRRPDPARGARRGGRRAAPPTTRSSPPTPACRRSGCRASSTMRGTRRLLGSYNLGSMANAMPQALGAQALDREPPGRRVLRRRRPDDAARRPASPPSPTSCRSSSSCSTTAGSAWSSSSRSRAGCRSSAPCSTTPTSPPSPPRWGSRPAG